ncbi:hypothetical protein L1987_70235 [Smallanthus sonchifolius]|uniref:Uncharacterized protein n=1 Tax=Smallanthus sonchifolius TaxID=185202 RepID=A0ACB9AP42_9ASTR|nr:hypothetical protein L1987_70235 [Smallanthus sonchifolius]
MVRVSCNGLVLLCSLRVMEGAPGFWAMVSGNRCVFWCHLTTTLWLFFYEPWSMFFDGILGPVFLRFIFLLPQIVTFLVIIMNVFNVICYCCLLLVVTYKCLKLYVLSYLCCY